MYALTSRSHQTKVTKHSGKGLLFYSDTGIKTHDYLVKLNEVRFDTDPYNLSRNQGTQQTESNKIYIALLSICSVHRTFM